MADTAHPDDLALVAALRRGDERAFVELVERFHPLLRRIARGYVRTDEAVADVVQETWIGVLRGLDRFEGRSSLRTWTVAILVNVARTRAVKDARSVPFADLDPEDDDHLPGLGPERFVGAGSPERGHWATPPTPWPEPEAAVLAGETRAAIVAAIAALPATQRAVITLRDVEGLTGPEVSDVLGVSEGNQRVLLHRARAKVRAALDLHLSASAGRTP